MNQLEDVGWRHLPTGRMRAEQVNIIIIILMVMVLIIIIIIIIMVIMMKIRTSVPLTMVDANTSVGTQLVLITAPVIRSQIYL